ncbi:hypothetical protein [Marinobacter sp. SS21]|uniref:hypothetical protein n=1 Tax=Marinobacter sp. SS21 TaxID=2979460 RepID=UPI00232F1662|nr:hypothetical protein [Marinobacter sp. SS21]MDC0664278.1 hypothetical protein [Marinobacter sp. SS21]
MALIGDNDTLRQRIKFWWLIPIIVVIGLYIAPALQTTKDVTVFLDGCVTEACELKGDLTIDLFSGEYTLRKADGTEISFTKDRVTFLHIPD